MKKIILVDDNQDILGMWKLYLEKIGYSPLTFESCRAFKDHVEHHGLNGVGCIICDESLQDGLGSSLFEHLQELSIHTPFIIVSGYGEEEILAKVKKPEKLKVLKKPISLVDLKTVIDESYDSGEDD